MGLPETIRVKLSSEAAEAITLTPVVVQDLPMRELISHMLGITGKDEPRIREILMRGTLVSGGSRFRWAGLEADLESIAAVLATFPDPDPSRPFSSAACYYAVLRGGRQSIEIPRSAVDRKGLLRRSTFWDLLMEVADGCGLTYNGYSYRECADRYTAELSTEAAEKVRSASEGVRFTTLRNQIRSLAFAALEVYVKR
jgi:hypothetical protein